VKSASDVRVSQSDCLALRDGIAHAHALAQGIYLMGLGLGAIHQDEERAIVTIADALIEVLVQLRRLTRRNLSQ